VVSYRVRSSEGADKLDWDDAPLQESDALSYERTFTDETGLYIFSVRAVDADGNEDSNISQLLAFSVEDGALVARPAEPRLVKARAIENGRIELEWLYDPRYEAYGPGAAPGAQGAAAEARIYWDAGTGQIDFSEPHATVPMGHPTEATRYTYQSAPLTDGQTYRFVVRVATAPWPTGIETQNADVHAVTADGSSPLAPALNATVV